MANRKVIEEYYCDIDNIAKLLTSFVNSYRLLIGGAAELNQITPATKRDVKKAIRRVDKMGDIIDELLETIEECEENYIDYCKVKADIISCKIEKNIILTEIDQEISFYNEEIKKEKFKKEKLREQEEKSNEEAKEEEAKK